MFFLMLGRCSGIYSWDRAYCVNGKRLLGNPRQRDYCGQEGEGCQFSLIFLAKLGENLGRCLYPFLLNHVLLL